ncbi:MAG: aspartate-semialdehyde dehydrogenase [Chloroflexi bacterium]|nr:aspartate-semialdehyde dehydrogenase [Chloroflexota bacterium]
MKAVGVLGATGAVGREFLEALEGHPLFAVSALFASDRSAQRPLREATRLDISGLTERIRDMVVKSADSGDAAGLDLVCSALPGETAAEAEPRYARQVPVISTSAAFRYENDVPILILEVNAEHAALLHTQKARGWQGWIAPQPNCTTVGLAVSLKPILDAFGVQRVVMTSYQAVSGGGYELIQRWQREREEIGPRIPAPGQGWVEQPETTIEGNVIGYISKEEPKVKAEVRKVLGTLKGGAIEPAGFDIDCFCVRVPSLEGHLEAVFVETARPCSPEDVRQAVAEFNARSGERFGRLPSAPVQAITVLDRVPQPRFDAELDRGLTTVMGRIEKSELGSRWMKYFVLSNNVKKGAALGSLQVLEYLEAQGYL